MFKLKNILKCLCNKEGRTILEFIVYLFLSSIIMIFLSLIITYTLKTSKIIFTKNELFENARVSIDFISKQVNAYDCIEIFTYENNTLHKLLLYKDIGTKKEHTATFEYIKIDKIFKFGGKGDKPTSKEVTQELAKYIENIEVKLNKEKKLLFMKIVTDISIDKNNIKLDKPIILKSVINLKYKSIISR